MPSGLSVKIPSGSSDVIRALGIAATGALMNANPMKMMEKMLL